jgi:hypothetical protein
MVSLRPILRRKWFRVLATILVLLGVLWGATYLFGPNSVESQFLREFPNLFSPDTVERQDFARYPKSYRDGTGREIPFAIKTRSEFKGEGLNFQAIDPPAADAYLCVKEPQVVAPLVVEIEYEWSGPGPFDGSAFRLTFLWTPWKSYLVGQKRHWVR